MPNVELGRSEAMARARVAASKALELDETLAEAHVSLAFVHMHFDWDWAQAEKAFKRAIELNPGYATAHHWYAYCLMAQRRREEATWSKRLHLDAEERIRGVGKATQRQCLCSYRTSVGSPVRWSSI